MFKVADFYTPTNALLYIFFWVFPRRQIIVYVKLYPPHRGEVFLISDFRRDLNIVYFLLGISPASNYIIYNIYNLTPGKYPEENIQYSNHGESLKSIMHFYIQ